MVDCSTPGIKDEDERKKRLGVDQLNSTKIKNSYSGFIKDWNDNQLFTKQKERNLVGWETQHSIRVGQNPEQILLSLQFLGVGEMPPKWDL